MKLRQREMYKQVSAEKKEALLLQRRTNRRALKKFTVSEVGDFPVQAQRADHLDGRCSASDNPLLMDFPTISATAAQCAAHLDCRCSTFVNPLPIDVCTVSGTTGGTSG